MAIRFPENPIRCTACGGALEVGHRYCGRCGTLVLSSGPASAMAADMSSEAVHDDEILWQGSFTVAGAVREIAITAAWTVLVLVWRGLGGGLGEAAPLPVDPHLVLIGVPWLLLAVWIGYRKLAAEYTLTRHQFVHRHGILVRRTHRLDVIDIDDLLLEQDLLQWWVNSGRLRILSSDRTDPDLSLEGLFPVHEIAEIFDRARRQERRRRGLHIETI